MPPKKILKLSYIKQQAAESVRKELQQFFHSASSNAGLSRSEEPLQPVDQQKQPSNFALLEPNSQLLDPTPEVVEPDLDWAALCQEVCLDLTNSANSDSSSSSEDDVSYESDMEKDGDCGLKESLQVWSNEYNISNVAINSLLSILKPLHPSLPLDARTLKETPRQSTVKVLKNGQYAHIGLKSALESRLKKGIADKIEKILIHVFVDGVRLYDSVSAECWPILARCSDFVDTKPFIIGIYYGTGKPDPIETYLADFIQEIIQLRTEGIHLDNKHYDFDVQYYIADAPARAYLKSIKGHTSKDGCERCDQEGEWQEGMVVYSIKAGTERTDDSFDSRRDVEHHKGCSPLTALGTQFISQFVLDPMHLVDIGVFKRFLQFVLGRGPVSVRMSGNQMRKFSELLFTITEYIPYEFCRKPTFDRLAKWKATEFRLLLLYIGPIAFQVLRKEIYQLFLLLHSAIFIMQSNVLIQFHLSDAKQFLADFVSYSSKVFGNKFVVYNVHNLLHLASDVERHGKLISFSAYPFEDKLGGLKKLVKSSSKPLQQICRRLAEIEKVEEKIDCKKQVRGLLYEHCHGPTADIDVLAQYGRYEQEQYTLSVSEPNNCVYLKDERVGFVQNIVRCMDSSVKVIVKLFLNSHDFYEYPIPSSYLGINKVNNLSNQLHVYQFSDILYKCICLPASCESEYVVFPLLHLM